MRCRLLFLTIWLVAVPGVAHAAGNVVNAYTTPGEWTHVVAAGVTTVHVVAIGANGGPGGFGVEGGFGAKVEGDLTVTPGQVLYLEVGGNGGQWRVRGRGRRRWRSVRRAAAREGGRPDAFGPEAPDRGWRGRRRRRGRAERRQPDRRVRRQCGFGRRRHAQLHGVHRPLRGRWRRDPGRYRAGRREWVGRQQRRSRRSGNAGQRRRRGLRRSVAADGRRVQRRRHRGRLSHVSTSRSPVVAVAAVA